MGPVRTNFSGGEWDWYEAEFAEKTPHISYLTRV